MNEQSELASKLKDILNKMSQEEFDNEWSKVISMNLQGPSFEEALEFFSLMQTQLSQFELIFSRPASYTGESNYALAA